MRKVAQKNDEEAQHIIEPYSFEPSGTSSGEDDGDDMDNGEDIGRLQNTEWLLSDAGFEPTVIMQHEAVIAGF
ncbi:hypothetical protein CesoFtcFv8_010655 [Champsocephalus esox]|uniref:Uncharacterized protein n=1 Tax=Champsocephalus esox TaxID=159716 RepID=A0AAN8H0D5_9TELE|nr:hypothetical protein CesoFtcFv8_010655 [Champsocephalus esox]